MMIPDVATELKKSIPAALTSLISPVESPRVSAEPESNRGIEKRRERRVETMQTANVRTLFGDVTWPALIRDVSPGGLGLSIQHRFPHGETLIVEWNHGFLIGRVRHTRPGRSGWITGVQLERMRAQEQLTADIIACERRARLQQLL